MSNKTRIAVLGAGRWGTHLVRNFSRHPQACLVAVADPNLDRLHHLGEQLQLGDEVRLVTDWSTVLQLPELEAVVIATPAGTHYHLVSMALKQNLHVLAEKPLTLDADAAIELCDLAEQQQRQLMVDQTYLFHPAVDRAKTALQAGILGDLRYGYSTRTHLGPVRQDVDALWDLAIHDIAIFNHWLGKTPVQVQAQGTVWLQATLPDLVWVTLTYADGFQVFIHLCWLNPDKQRRSGVVGSKGSLIFDELAAESLVIQYGQFQGALEAIPGTKLTYTPVNQSREVLEVEPLEPLQQVCHHFLDCVRSNTPSPISSGRVGAELVRILAALTQSLRRSGEPIEI